MQPQYVPPSDTKGTGCPTPPLLVPRSFLRSLDQRNISNGAAEMLKMACIKDEELFHLLEEHGEDMMVSKFQVRALAPGCVCCQMF
jgi:2-epi-5-epi-valiolone synthase